MTTARLGAGEGERLIGALVPALVGDRPRPVPAPLPMLPTRRLPRGCEMLLDVAQLDRSGRVSARGLLRALEWRAGGADRLGGDEVPFGDERLVHWLFGDHPVLGEVHRWTSSQPGLPNRLRSVRRWANIHRTCGAVYGWGSSLCRRPAPGSVDAVGVRSGVTAPVPVRWGPAQMAALDAGLGAYRGEHPEPSPEHLAFGLHAEQPHQRQVGRVVEVDRSVDLGQP